MRSTALPQFKLRTQAVKAEPGSSWKSGETQVVPKNRLAIVFTGFMATVFLAALDQTIVATALPTIVSHLGGGSGYSWVGRSVPPLFMV